jgi:hypothetical protein
MIWFSAMIHDEHLKYIFGTALTVIKESNLRIRWVTHEDDDFFGTIRPFAWTKTLESVEKHTENGSNNQGPRVVVKETASYTHPQPSDIIC